MFSLEKRKKKMGGETISLECWIVAIFGSEGQVEDLSRFMACHHNDHCCYSCSNGKEPQKKCEESLGLGHGGHCLEIDDRVYHKKQKKMALCSNKFLFKTHNLNTICSAYIFVCQLEREVLGSQYMVSFSGPLKCSKN